MKPNPTPYTGSIHPREGKDSTPLRPAGMRTRIRRTGTALIGGLILSAVTYFIGVVAEYTWLEWTALGLLILVTILVIQQGAFAAVGPCPYCGTIVGDQEEDFMVITDRNRAVECLYCHEWLISGNRTLRPIDEATYLAKPEVRAPVFEFGEYANECITCGAPAVRHDSIVKTSLQPEWLLLGGIVTNKSFINGIPYCHAHADQIAFYYLRGKSRFRFQDLGAMRRYLTFNAGKNPVQPTKEK